MDLYGAGNYGPPELTFLAFALGALASALALWHWDLTKGGLVLTHATKGAPGGASCSPTLPMARLLLSAAGARSKVARLDIFLCTSNLTAVAPKKKHK